jgi:hypothetical protein
LLLRANPGEDWDASRVATRLYTTEQEATEVLARLCAQGLIACEGGIYRFDRERGEFQGLVDRLAETYSRHLIPVTNLIHAKPSRIREFANAFRFRKDR